MGRSLGDLGSYQEALAYYKQALKMFKQLYKNQDHPAIAVAELTGIPGMYHVQAQGITIATSADPQDVTLDGELRGQTPITTYIANQRLHVIVPQ